MKALEKAALAFVVACAATLILSSQAHAMFFDLFWWIRR
jgi:hypothetical protein